MKVQQIGNYTKQYSSNKNQQSNNSNLNFGKIEVIDLRRSTKLIDRVCGFVDRIWEKIDKAAGFRLKVLSKENLRGTSKNTIEN